MLKDRKDKTKEGTLKADFSEYLDFWHRYLKNRIYTPFSYFESAKGVVVGALYKNRGKNAQPILHIGAIGTAFAVVIIAPLLFNNATNNENGSSQGVLAANSDEVSFYTMQAEEVRQMRGGEVTIHAVLEGETVETIAAQYGLQEDTIRWENNLGTKQEPKVGVELRILPVDGVRHKVAKGETITSIGKKYGLEDTQVQAIVDFPFNDFVNDETFELAAGQYLMVPGGRKATVSNYATYASILTPNAGTISASGVFIWPASGRITQGYSFYHKAIDIANSGAGPILAADSGVVIASGWDPTGYGNRVIVDHANGLRTLYAHMSVLQVVAGQTVNQGDVVGQMGSTGRSTGTHLHFEIRQDSVLLNPFDWLR